MLKKRPALLGKDCVEKTALPRSVGGKALTLIYIISGAKIFWKRVRNVFRVMLLWKPTVRKSIPCAMRTYNSNN